MTEFKIIGSGESFEVVTSQVEARVGGKKVKWNCVGDAEPGSIKGRGTRSMLGGVTCMS